MYCLTQILKPLSLWKTLTFSDSLFMCSPAGWPTCYQPCWKITCSISTNTAMCNKLLKCYSEVYRAWLLPTPVLFVLHPIMFLLIYVLHLMLKIIKVLPFYFLVSASLVIRDILAYFWQVLSRQQWCIAHNWTVSYFLRNHMRNNPIIISLFQSMKGGVFHWFNWVLVLNNFCFGLPSLSTLVH